MQQAVRSIALACALVAAGTVPAGAATIRFQDLVTPAGGQVLTDTRPFSFRHDIRDSLAGASFPLDAYTLSDLTLEITLSDRTNLTGPTRGRDQVPSSEVVQAVLLNLGTLPVAENVRNDGTAVSALLELGGLQGGIVAQLTRTGVLDITLTVASPGGRQPADVSFLGSRLAGLADPVPPAVPQPLPERGPFAPPGPVLVSDPIEIPVPEPASLALLGTALLGLGLLRRARRRG